MTNDSDRLLIAFYGDDFTGSTDALESLSLAGARTVLFIEPPTPEQLSRYDGIQAIGVAGMTRAMAPEEMEKELTESFTDLHRLNPRHIHYKVCSTFDSSPAIGSIGLAIDTGTRIFNSAFVPLLVGAPTLGRFCVFGNLFARMGIGSSGSIYRLDRHPSMSRHPATPADESDLRLHLAKQTKKKIGLVDILQITLPLQELKKVVDGKVDQGDQILLFDALYEEQMQGIGQLIDSYTVPGESLFSVGSSGIERALGSFWKSKKVLEPVSRWPEAVDAGPILVVCGSCSPVTAGQIERAVKDGFVEMAIDATAVMETGVTDEVVADYIKNAAELLRKGKSVMVHTGVGAAGSRVMGGDNKARKPGMTTKTAVSGTAELLGTALGFIARAIAGVTEVKRIVIAGGDTSSFAARAMGIEAVEMIMPLSPGAPLCKAYAPHSPIDQLEVNFKGGQVGGEDYFGMVKRGRF